SGTITANQGGAPWSQNLTQVNGSAAVTLAAGELKVGVEGLAASGAAVSGNPVYIGGTNFVGTLTAVGVAAETAACPTNNIVAVGGKDGGSLMRPLGIAPVNAALPTTLLSVG